MKIRRIDIGEIIRKIKLENNYINKLCLLLLAFAFVIPITSAAYVTLTNTVVNQNQVFDVNILIDSIGKPISGAQLDIEFNRSMFKINNISEGKLFTQNNASTFFNKGVINNKTGNVKNMFNVIIGNHSVSSPGVFIIVNMTAIGQGGSSLINLSNVKISDPDALPVPVTNINGSIKINITPELIPDNFSNVVGKVIRSYDVTGISGVAVKLTDSNGINKSTITNSTGYYNFSNIKQDFYSIDISKSSFFPNSTSLTVNKSETKIINLNLWLKGDLNNNGISADAGDLAMMQDASVKKITPDWRFDLNKNKVLADAGDLAMMQDASVKKIILI